MQIKKANIADENFSLTVSKSANEVVATYTKDETKMDLIIRLPASYPLRPVDVECMRSLGISEVKQRKWLMSMMLFVRNQVLTLASYSVLFFLLLYAMDVRSSDHGYIHGVMIHHRGRWTKREA